MKIIWSPPPFDNPQTGGEIACNRLEELLVNKGAILIKVYHEYKGITVILKKINPDFSNSKILMKQNKHAPQTGGEAALKRQEESLEIKDAALFKVYQKCREIWGAIRKIYINFRNLKILMRQDKHAPIFQNLRDRPEYLLANVFLHYLFKRKIILLIHEIYETGQLSFIRRLYHLFMNYISFESASLIVVNSRYSGDWVCKYGNFEGKLFLMYPAIDLKIKNSKKIEKSKSSPINILCVGNIRRKKGQIYLLQAMESVQSDYKINFVGLTKEKEEDYWYKLQEYIAEKGMADKVHFSGFLRDQRLAEAYQNADIFVSPSIMEEFGMVIWEAMSFGLPIVANKTGGVLEQVTDGQEGFLVPLRDPKALADKISTLISDPELRVRMGTLARKRAARLPILDQVFEQFYQVVEGLS